MDDKLLRQAVVDALDFEPGIDGSDIGVATERGVVALTGHVKNFAEKAIVERVVSRIKGVQAIALDVEVRYGVHSRASDDQIAERALHIIRWNALVPDAAIQVKVEKGWVTLSGQVDWRYQRDAAESAIRKLSGVVGVINRVELKIKVVPSDVKRRIKDALRRDAEIDAEAITVNVADGTVTLEGKVKAWHERKVVEHAAWAVPGVARVDDHLKVAA